MNFSAIHRSTFLGKVLRLPLRVIPPGAVFPVLQGRLKGRRWIVGSCDHGCWLGSYEYQKQRLFSERIKPGSTVYDIGAHSGFYSLLAAEIVGPQGKVFSFELLPRNIGFLKKHIQMNGYVNIEVVEAAVSDRDGTALFKEAESSLMGCLSPDGGLEVRTVRLDSLLSQAKLPAPQYIKMDIEGGEYGALRGAEQLLRTHKPTIFLATHGEALHAKCCDFLRELGYDLQPVKKTDEIHNTDEILAC